MLEAFARVSLIRSIFSRPYRGSLLRCSSLISLTGMIYMRSSFLTLLQDGFYFQKKVKMPRFFEWQNTCKHDFCIRHTITRSLLGRILRSAFLLALHIKSNQTKLPHSAHIFPRSENADDAASCLITLFSVPFLSQLLFRISGVSSEEKGSF